MDVDVFDFYFTLLCFVSIIVLAVLVSFFMDNINKDRDNE